MPSANCRRCGTPLPAGSRFCNECGLSATATEAAASAPAAAAPGALPPGPPPSGDNALAKYLPWGLAAILLVSVAGYFIGQQSSATAAAPALDAGAAPFAPFANGGGGGGGTPPDLGSMTPRERSQRLYDRIMRYAEEGKKDSIGIFAPMAIASFEMLGAELDTDARYDLGKVAIEAGQLEIASAQADTILKAAPTHLLGLALKARAATAQNDSKSASASWKAFSAARDGEMKKNLPEYQMHAADIEAGTKAASGK